MANLMTSSFHVRVLEAWALLPEWPCRAMAALSSRAVLVDTSQPVNGTFDLQIVQRGHGAIEQLDEETGLFSGIGILWVPDASVSSAIARRACGQPLPVLALRARGVGPRVRDFG